MTNRQLTFVWCAVVLVLCGTAMGASDTTLYPRQASPGETVALQSPRLSCLPGQRPAARVYVGSALASIECDKNSAGQPVLKVFVPQKAAPGPQRVRFVPIATPADDVEGSWFNVLPPAADLLVMPKLALGKGKIFDLNKFLKDNALSLQPPSTLKLQGTQFIKDVEIDISKVRLEDFLIPRVPSFAPQQPFPKTPYDKNFFKAPNMLTGPQVKPPSPWPAGFVDPGSVWAPRQFAPAGQTLPPPATPSVFLQRENLLLEARAQQEARAQRSAGVSVLRPLAICDRPVYSLSAAQALRLQPVQGLLFEALRDWRSDIVLAPSTSGIPPVDNTPVSDGGVLSDYEKTERTYRGLQTIGIMQKIGGVWQRVKTGVDVAALQNIEVVVIDSLAADGTDAMYTDVIKINSVDYLFRGHGTWVRHLIDSSEHGVAPGVAVTSVPACGPDGCRVDVVVKALCDAQAGARRGKRVIVNASLSTPYDNPILREAIADAAAAGVAVVVAYGNGDRCNEDGGRLDYCNAFPADFTGDLTDLTFANAPLPRSLYSVGASEQNGTVPQVFQRGDPRAPKLREVLTTPDVFAPAFFWFQDPLPDEWKKANMDQTAVSVFAEAAKQGALRPHKGTSYAAPLVTGALALWAAKYPNCDWPSLSNLKGSSTGVINVLHVPTLLEHGCQ